MSFYHNTEKHFRLGAGITYQFSNELKGSKDASAASAKFKNASGFVVEGDYMAGIERTMTLGLRYTVISYATENFGGSVNGNSFGFNFTHFWF